jgi:hypothetical protein
MFGCTSCGAALAHARLVFRFYISVPLQPMMSLPQLRLSPQTQYHVTTDVILMKLVSCFLMNIANWTAIPCSPLWELQNMCKQELQLYGLNVSGAACHAWQAASGRAIACFCSGVFENCLYEGHHIWTAARLSRFCLANLSFNSIRQPRCLFHVVLDTLAMQMPWGSM